MGSNPLIKERLRSMLQRKHHVEADSIEELKCDVEMDDVSNTQFRQALKSLHYNPGPVHLNRPLGDHMSEPRPFHVTYVGG